MEGTKLLSNQALVHTKGYIATERSFLRIRKYFASNMTISTSFLQFVYMGH